MLPPVPSTSFDWNACVRPVTLSPGWRPLSDGVALEAVVPSYTFVSVTAEMVSDLFVIVPEALLVATL